MEYRIEDLSRTAGVPVDTIRFYQGKGLIDPPRRSGRVTYYGDAHLKRLEQIRRLQQRGFTLAIIRRFLAGELEESDQALVAAVTVPAGAGGAGSAEALTRDELAARSGVAGPLIDQLVDAGLLVPEPGPEGPLFPASDLDLLRAGLVVLEAGIPLSDVLVLARQQAGALDASAVRAVELFDQHVRERLQAAGGSAEDTSERLIEQFDRLLDASQLLVGAYFRRALIRAARHHIERDGGS